MKRFLALFLAVCLCFGCVPVTHVHAEEVEGDPQAENSWRYENGEIIDESLIVEDSEEAPTVFAVYPSSSYPIGIDVSEHQGQINWDSVKAEIDFAIIRCGFGQDQAGQQDDWFVYNVQACERLGIPYGIYHYAYAQNATRAAGEADHALRLVKAYCGNMLKLPIYYDMEETSTISGKSASEIYNQAAAFCDKIAAAGYMTGIYANTNWWNNYLVDSRFNQKVNAGTWHRWVAQYNSSCTYSGKFQIWQFTSDNGYVSSFPGRLDINYLIDDIYGIGSGGSSTVNNSVINTNKDVYYSREPILVTASTPINDAWVGIYPNSSSYTGSSLAWYSLRSSTANIYNYKTVNIYDCGSYDTSIGYFNWNPSYMEDLGGDMWGALVPGSYKVGIYTGEGTSRTEYASKVIEVKAATSYNTTSLTTDKTVYATNSENVEDVFVTVNCPTSQLTGSAWVGIFPASADLTNSGQKSIGWFYCYNHIGSPINIWDAKWNNDWYTTHGGFESLGDDWPLPAGEYVVALFSDGGRNVVTKTTIILVDPSNATVSTDKNTYCVNQDILVSTNYQSDSAWVGLYKSTTTPGESNPSIYWYYVTDAGMSNVNILDRTTGDTAALDPSTTTSYKVVLFQDGGYTSIASKNITINACSDGTKDHNCDTCGKPVSDHKDENKDHNCDTCGKPVSDHKDENKDHNCDLCEKPLSDCQDENKDHKCDTCDKTLSECKDEDKDYKCDICDKDLDKPAPEVGSDRLAGEDRFDTAFIVANKMKEELGVEKFNTIIVASGKDFADALSGSYLAAVKNAPILLSYKDKQNQQVMEYIRLNLAKGGIVYILGGTKAVPESMEKALSDLNVKRLAGENRFDTNTEILKEVGVPADETVLVCTGTDFADCLSGSAVGKPIMLVYKRLMDSQKKFLPTLDNDFCIIGGENAVNKNIETTLQKYGEVERLAGAHRYETSVLVAEKFFQDPDSAVLAYAKNYPDGLCGGALAVTKGAPLLLTDSKYFSFAAEYAEKNGISFGVVLGGKKLISDKAVEAIFGE